MKIIIFGAGAIGSLFGALLSNNNDVTLIGRKDHINTINKNGFKIYGKTELRFKIKSETSVEKVDFSPDIIIITVKSFDTEKAILQLNKIINQNTLILSLQNGLDNIEKIKKIAKSDQIFAGVTTHGALFSKPGIIKHTGIGDTIIGSLTDQDTALGIVNIFNQSGIKTTLSEDVLKEIWVKVIINSSINPITALFNCKNGYLLENPVLKNIVERVCFESTFIANKYGFKFSKKDILDKTLKVIRGTSDNYSSMAQDLSRHKKTEIDSINGKIVEFGEKNTCDVLLNKSIFYMIKSME